MLYFSSEDYWVSVTLESGSTYSPCLISSSDQFRVGLPWRKIRGVFRSDKYAVEGY